MSAVIVASLFSVVEAEIYLWPLHGSRMLSSSFGEFRDGHYHAGIDLRNFGRVGLPCLAVCDGSVPRIRISPTGYGKALYLRLDDGRTAVYAHLHGFNRALDSLAYYRRLESGTSWCDINLPGESFRISVGETLCYTGASGTTAPHLHFEMRDRKGRPFNPLQELYSVPDERTPVISGLEVVPLSSGSLVNGNPLPVISLFRASGSRFYVLDDTLQMDGRFGFGASIWDEQVFGSYKMAPLSIELFIDGELLYSVRNSNFSYSQAREILLEYDLFGKGAAGRYILLFRIPGSTRSDREGTGVIHSDEGLIDGLFLREGVHKGEIVARDASGNESHAFFHFALHSFPEISTARKLVAASEVVVASYDPDGGDIVGKLYESLDGGENWMGIAMEPSGRYWRGDVSSVKDAVYKYIVRDDEGAVVPWYFATPLHLQAGGKVFCECIPEVEGERFVIRIITDCILVSVPRIARTGVGSTDSCRVYRLGPREYTAICDFHAVTDGVNVFRVAGWDHRGFPLVNYSAFRIFKLTSGKTVRFNVSDSLHVDIRALEMWGRALCLVREVPAPGEPPPGLISVSQPFLLDIPVDHLAKSLRMACDPGEKVGLFKWKENKGWKCIGVPAMEGGTVEIDRSGIYAFFRDGLPPNIRHVAVERQLFGSGFFKPNIYYVPVVEEGSGIDPYSAVVFINGSKAVCEWDAFRKRLDIPIPVSTPAGPVSLRVELCDRAGNSSVGEFNFVLE
ncbi:MAG: M23 family metallopeptidase [Candidatus Krumholzibacteria bacterium]|nr:M23 family metallopeptidase [Candidatus Krumholzibacteria bacterium]